MVSNSNQQNTVANAEYFIIQLFTQVNVKPDLTSELFFWKHPWKLEQKLIILIVEPRFSMEGICSYCILTG